MVNEIRIYAEGGGDGKDTKATIRCGFGEFLSGIRARSSSLLIMPCFQHNPHS